MRKNWQAVEADMAAAFLKWAVIGLLVVGVVLFALTQLIAHRIEARFPPAGKFAEVEGVLLHYVDIQAGADADLLPMVFLHGASGNARDLMGAFGPALEGRTRMIFIDRPGAGYSQRGREASIGDPSNPEVQARLVSGLLREIGLEKAVIVGHSLGGAVTAAFALNHSEQAHGLVFIAPATHPWPGGGVTWYYDVVNFPVLGRLFSETLAVPSGYWLYPNALKGVFEPERVAKSYADASATRLVLRPANFRNNGRDVGNLFGHVTRMSKRYGEIDLPTVIITGDKDTVVRADIHSEGLERDIEGAKLVWLDGVGHMPTYTQTSRIIAEIEALNREIAAPSEAVAAR